MAVDWLIWSYMSTGLLEAIIFYTRREITKQIARSIQHELGLFDIVSNQNLQDSYYPKSILVNWSI